jgi:hypothetical protein
MDFHDNPYTVVGVLRNFDSAQTFPLVSNRLGNTSEPGTNVLALAGKAANYTSTGSSGISVQAPGPLPNQAWIAAGWDGALSWAQDNGGRNTVARTAPVGASSYPLRIGSYANGTVWAQGALVAAAIFDRALTDEEIARATEELAG